MTAFLQVKNRAISTLASGISDTDTSLTVTPGEGAKFPQPGNGFNITIDDEILKCTGRSTDTLTVTRAQEGTTAAAHSAGAAVSLNITAAVVQQLQDHEALTTGIHGVGSDYICGAKSSGVKARDFVKGWTSGKVLKGAGVDANPTEVYLPEFEKNWLHENWLHNPEIAETIWTVAFVNTGDISNWAANRIWLNTGSTINSAVQVYTSYTTITGFGSGLIAGWCTAWTDRDRTNSTVLFWLVDYTEAKPPALTDIHIGFKVINGAIWATSCDGTHAENADDTGITYSSAWAIHSLHFIHKGTSIDYYVDGVLKVTQSTNLPSSATGYIYNSITNEVAAVREIELRSINIRGI